MMISFSDLGYMLSEQIDEFLDEFFEGAEKNLEINHRFSLVKKPLFRIKLLQLSEQKYLFVFTLHHLISDVWSLGLLGTEIATIYDSFAQGQLSPLNDLPIQYVDFAQWQQDMIRDNAFVADSSYWQNKLANAEAKLDLPIEKEPTSFLTFSCLWYFLDFVCKML